MLITCEHAGNAVPREYSGLFGGAARQLAEHTGWDPGAKSLAELLARHMHVPCLSYPYTRLLIEPNRSEGHPALFSSFTKGLPEKVHEKLLQRYYRPYRRGVCKQVEKLGRSGAVVVHVGVHTFTPLLNGRERDFEIGLLYDPRRHAERGFCCRWRDELQQTGAELRVRMNRPYRGTSDGLTTWLRGEYGIRGYLGVELEVNQRLYAQGLRRWRQIGNAIAVALERAITV